MKCTECERDDVRPDQQQVSRTVAGINFVADMPATKCEGCGGTTFELGTLEQFELRIAETLAQMAIRTGEAFRFMRRAAGLRAIDLADFLGVTPETISRWEAGKWEPDKAAFAALAALVRDKVAGTQRAPMWSLFDALRGPSQPRKSSEPVFLRL